MDDPESNLECLEPVNKYSFSFDFLLGLNSFISIINAIKNMKSISPSSSSFIIIKYKYKIEIINSKIKIL